MFKALGCNETTYERTIDKEVEEPVELKISRLSTGKVAFKLCCKVIA